MPKLYSSKWIRKVLESHAFSKLSQKGSHGKFSNGERTVILPMNKKEIPQGTFASILRQSGLKREDFEV